MDVSLRATFLMTQAACMNARLVAMQAQNMEDREAGRPVTYRPYEFETLPDQYQLGYNAVLNYLQGG